MASDDPDLEWVERAQAELPHGTGAYQELVRRHSTQVYRRTFRILRSREDAEEATQDVFLALFRNLSRFRPEKPFVHWLGIITLNACRMVLRKRAQERRRRDALQEEQEVPAERPSEQGDPLMRDLLRDALDELDPGTRIPLLLHHVEGLTYGEIAEQMELGESAIKMRISRGAAKLRDRIGKARSDAPGKAASDGE